MNNLTHSYSQNDSCQNIRAKISREICQLNKYVKYIIKLNMSTALSSLNVSILEQILHIYIFDIFWDRHTEKSLSETC